MKPVLAFDIGNAIPWGNQSLGQQYQDTGSLITILLKNSFTIAGLILLIFLIYGGLMFIIGAGGSDPKKAQAAQGIIVNTLIGFAIVFLSYFIIQIIQVITGLNILNSNL